MSFCFCMAAGVASFGADEKIVFHRPVSSPDGGLIAFTLECAGLNEAATARLDGSGFQRLTANDLKDWYPHWSPDGKRLVFFRGGEENDTEQYEIVWLDLESGDETLLASTGFYEGDPAFTPDGRRVVFNSNRTGNHDVYIMQEDGTKARRLTDNELSDFSPTVSPDGTTLAYVGKTEEGYRLFLMDLEGGNRRMLSVGRLENYKPAWSPDGKSLIFFGPENTEEGGSTAGDFDIYRFHLETRELDPLTITPGSEADPTWSPDGQNIYFTSNRRGQEELFVMTADGRNQQPLFQADNLDAIVAECRSW